MIEKANAMSECIWLCRLVLAFRVVGIRCVVVLFGDAERNVCLPTEMVATTTNHGLSGPFTAHAMMP